MPSGPATAAADDVRLYVLPLSHFCERARWGLDHAGIAYREVGWVVGLHIALARRIAPASTLPILRAEGRVIQGSDLILDWAGLEGGHPDLERRLETGIGPLGRSLVYAGTLSRPDCPVKDALFDGVAPWQRAVGGALWPATRRVMIATMDAAPQRLGQLAVELDRELDWFDAELSRPGGLAAAPFGRAAITAASLLAPLALPKELPLYARLQLPPDLAAVLDGWAARPSLRWTRDIYASRRRPARQGSWSSPGCG